MAKVTFEDKEKLIDHPDVPRKNKIIAEDINELKRVINENENLGGGSSTAENIIDCNEVEENGVFYTNAETLNCPMESTAGFLVSLVKSNKTVRIQYWFRYRDDQMYIRKYNTVNSNSDGTTPAWSDWEDISVHNPLVYEKVLAANTTSLSIPCDILKHGGHYRLVVLGKTTTRSDIEITFNNDSSSVYYQQGVHYSSDATNTDANLTGASAYRPAKTRFYYAMNFWEKGTGKITMNIDYDKTSKCAVVDWKIGRTFTGGSLTGWGNGQTSPNSAENITSINLKPANGMLVEGTKVQLFRD